MGHCCVWNDESFSSIATEKYRSSVMGIALMPIAFVSVTLALIHCNLLAIFLCIHVTSHVLCKRSNGERASLANL